VDYAHRARLKILGRARVVEDDPDLIERLSFEGYPAKVERAIVIDVEGFNWNCQQHIPELFPAGAVHEALDSLRERIAELERQNAELRGTRP